ncbi:MAG TPA: hypothetical protein VHQ66_04820 [Myxococcota bacterium]|jgi:hypothetical protein|nr:hypothetical protein [Myxococcota bacterium]
MRRSAAAALFGALALAASAVPCAAFAEAPAAGTEERTVCEWVVEPRYVGSGAPKLEPQRVCRTEAVHRPAPPAVPEGVRPAGQPGTGIVVESEPAPPSKDE